MKIALVQQHAGPDREENLVRGLAAIDGAAARGANVVCFAELAFTFLLRDRRPDLYGDWLQR